MRPTLLSISASPRTDARSLSRRLAARFVDTWRRRHPGGRVLHRDLRDAPPAFIDNDWIAAAFQPPGERSASAARVLAESDRFVDEFLSADEYVLATPVYNFGMPSVLKAYVDQIVRIGRTFDMDPGGASPYRPLVPPGRRLTVLVATGDAGYEAGGRYHHMNFLEPQVRTIFGLLGVEDVSFIYVGHDEADDEARARALAAALAQVDGSFHPSAADAART